MNDLTSKPETLPLYQSESLFQGSLYNPVSELVAYVNLLLREGFQHETIDLEFSALYMLDFYKSQVGNGGHSQFVGNCGPKLEATIERATLGANLMGLPEFADLLSRCAQWCRDNPDEAKLQNGFKHRADALDALDSELYALKMSEDDLNRLLAELPEQIAKHFAQRLIVPSFAEKLKEEFVAEALKRFADESAENAVKAAFPILDPLVDWALECKLHRSEQGVRDDLSRWWGKNEPWEVANFEKELRRRVRSTFFERTKIELDVYYMRTCIWLANHPKRIAVPDEEWRTRVEVFGRANPVAQLEQAKRAHKELHEAVENEDRLCLAALLGKVLKDPSEAKSRSFDYSDPKNTEGSQRHILKVSDRSFFVVKQNGRTSLRTVRPNYFKKLVRPTVLWLRRHGLVSGPTMLNILTGMPERKPGALVASSKSDMALYPLIRDLYVPEAICEFWRAVDPKAIGERRTKFERGLVFGFDHAQKSLRWRMETDDGPIIISATKESVEVEGRSARSVFTKEELAARREALS